jgi:hypothetical protein
VPARLAVGYGIAEANIFENWVMGKDVSKYVCEQDWIGICQCKTQ